MGVIAKGILRGCHGLSTPVSLRYPLSVFNKNSTLKASLLAILLVLDSEGVSLESSPFAFIQNTKWRKNPIDSAVTDAK